MADSTILISNERYKSWSTNFTRLGSGLIAYAVVDLYIDLELKWSFVPPFTIGVILSWLGWKFLGLLESEK
jgi:hypothetical protein